MTTFAPIITAFNQRTAFWPPEAFTLDCRIEERIWEWCEDKLKDNKEFMSLVNSDTPLDMIGLWQQVEGLCYGDLVNCIFHYWLIQNWQSHKEGKPFCRQNADWICARIQIKGPMPWHAEHPPASKEEMTATYTALHAAAEAVGAAAAAAAAAVAAVQEADAPAAAGAGSPPLDLGPSPAGVFVEEMPKKKQKDIYVCLTQGSEMTVLHLSDIPTLSYDELRKYYRDIQLYAAQSYSPEDCENAGIILEEIYNHLHA